MWGRGTLWTEERVERLRQLWLAGASASETARELDCGLSRNAVIGKVSRMGLPSRRVGQRQPWALRPAPDRPARPMRPKRRKPVYAIQRKADPLPPDAPKDDASDLIRTEHSCSLLDLTNETCRWPCGDPASPSFFFCGRPANYNAGRVYCPAHTLRAMAKPFVISDEERERRRAHAYRIGSHSPLGAAKRAVERI